VISDVNNTVVATIPVGNYPDGVAYDSGKGEVFVTRWDWNAVSVILDTSNTATSSVTVGAMPTFVAYVVSNGYVYVSNEHQGTLSIIAPTPPTNLTTNQTADFLGLPGYDGYILIGPVSIMLLTIAITVYVRRKRAPPASVSISQANLPEKLP
jgi:YVTN family beta-propeller protein